MKPLRTVKSVNVKGAWQFGFTLVELMIVIAIMGTLAGIAVPSANRYLQIARQTKIIQEMKMIEKDIFMFYAENGFFPDSLADIGLETLKDPWGNPYQYLKIEGTTNGKPGSGDEDKTTGKPDKDEDKTTGKPDKDNVIKGIPRKDHFLVPVNTDFDLYSMGPDGKSVAPFTAQASRDDIVRANNGQYMGRASEY